MTPTYNSNVVKSEPMLSRPSFLTTDKFFHSQPSSEKRENQLGKMQMRKHCLSKSVMTVNNELVQEVLVDLV